MAKNKPMTARTAQQIGDDAIRHQVFLERLKSGYVKDLTSAVKQAEDAVISILRDLESDDLSELTKRQLEDLLQRINTAQQEILNKSTRQFNKDLKDTAMFEAEREAKALDQWASKVASGTPKFKVPSATAVFERVQAQPIHATGQLLQGFIDSYSASVVRRAENAVRNGWSQGKTIGDITRQLRGTKKANYKDGLGIQSRREAEAVARTAVQQVANTARTATWEANSDVVKGYIIVATLDSVTTTICRSLDKQRFKIGKGPMPPLHVNCRSTTIADLGPAFDFLDKGATRSSADGYVSSKLSYYDWLKTQEPEFVKDALGATRAKLFSDGGLSAGQFAKLNLGRDFEPLTLAEMREKDAAAFKRAGL